MPRFWEKYTHEREQVLRAWCAALRSGEFKQGRQYLHSAAGEYCCLGVLVETLKHKIKVERTFNASVQSYAYADPGSGGHDTSNVRSGYLPPSISEHVGLTAMGHFPQGVSVVNTRQVYPANNLVQCNDGLRADFNDIAGIIERVFLDDYSNPISSDLAIRIAR